MKKPYDPSTAQPINASRLGIVFIAIHFFIWLSFCTHPSNKFSHSGFGLIFLMLFDFAVAVPAFIFSFFMQLVIPGSSVQDQVWQVGIPLLFLGSAQWYYIGAFISKLFDKTPLPEQARGDLVSKPKGE